MSNEINQVRAKSFEDYAPGTPLQEQALSVFQQISAGLISKAPQIVHDQYPFSDGALYIVSGTTGVGKTHLMESLVNEIRGRAPGLLQKMYLFRENFNMHNFEINQATATHPIILIDDLYSDLQSVKELHSHHINYLMDFLTNVYERRNLVIATTNFPFLSQIVPLISKHDAIGRTRSRINELITANAGEFLVDGPDYREFLASAQQVEKPEGRIILPFGRPSDLDPK